MDKSISLSPKERFGIMRKTGYDPVAHAKPIGYLLVDTTQNNRVIQEVGPNGYALLVHIKKQNGNPNFFKIIKK